MSPAFDMQGNDFLTPHKTQSRTNQSPAGKKTNLERVWEKLEGGQWESRAELQAACDEDSSSLTQIITFLDRWNFIEMEHRPELRVRRKPKTLSPTETFRLLTKLAPQKNGHVIAKRVACRSCGKRQFRFIEGNIVECSTCRERQWYAVTNDTPLSQAGY